MNYCRGHLELDMTDQIPVFKKGDSEGFFLAGQGLRMQKLVHGRISSKQKHLSTAQTEIIIKPVVPRTGLCNETCSLAVANHKSTTVK